MMDYGLAKTFGNRVDAAYENRDEWMAYAKKKEAELQELQEKYDKVSRRFETLMDVLDDMDKNPTYSVEMWYSHQPVRLMLQFHANDEAWSIRRKREENIRHMAEAEYDVHVYYDPIFRLKKSADSLSAIAEKLDDKESSEQIREIVEKMRATSSIRDDAYREKFIKDRISELTEHVRYESDHSSDPIADSVPEARLLDSVRENPEDHWHIMSAYKERPDLLLE